MDNDTAGVVELTADQNFVRSEPEAEKKSPEEASYVDSTCSVVTRRDVVVTLGIVKLVGVGVDDDIVVRQLAKVDAGARRQRGLCQSVEEDP